MAIVQANVTANPSNSNVSFATTNQSQGKASAPATKPAANQSVGPVKATSPAQSASKPAAANTANNAKPATNTSAPAQKPAASASNTNAQPGQSHQPANNPNDVQHDFGPAKTTPATNNNKPAANTSTSKPAASTSSSAKGANGSSAMAGGNSTTPGKTADAPKTAPESQSKPADNAPKTAPATQSKPTANNSNADQNVAPVAQGTAQSANNANSNDVKVTLDDSSSDSNKQSQAQSQSQNSSKDDINGVKTDSSSNSGTAQTIAELEKKTGLPASVIEKLLAEAEANGGKAQFQNEQQHVYHVGSQGNAVAQPQAVREVASSPVAAAPVEEVAAPASESVASAPVASAASSVSAPAQASAPAASSSNASSASSLPETGMSNEGIEFAAAALALAGVASMMKRNKD